MFLGIATNLRGLGFKKIEVESYGILPFGIGTRYHRTIFVDVKYMSFIRENTMKIVRAKGIKLQSWALKVRDKYYKIFKNNFRKLGILSKIHTIYQSCEKLLSKKISTKTNSIDIQK